LIADYVNEGDRVLVIGAGGGLGSHLCQILRNKRGASLVVGTSKSPQRLLQPPLCYDRAIDYTKEDVFTMTEYMENPFDVIIDFAAGHWPRIVQQNSSPHDQKLIVKSHANGGRYITTNPDQPTYDIPSMWKMMEIFLFPALWRAAVSRTWSRSTLPGYTFAFALPSDRQVMTRTMELAQDGTTLQAVLHSNQCFDFTTEGVRAAFHVMESRHTEGKVIIKVADDE
jgi:NADPH:quinone reductase-like Zn-dependent oxidoreductase